MRRLNAEMIEEIAEVAEVCGKVYASPEIEVLARLAEAAQIKPNHAIESA
jgi:hypothetical protein